MARRHDKSSYARIAYPPGCKELSEELSKEELLKRLKVGNVLLLCILSKYYHVGYRISVSVLGECCVSGKVFWL